MKRILSICILAFIGNIVWEHAHAFLYVSYKGGEITTFILARAALFDAVIIGLISLPFLSRCRVKHRFWLLFVLATLVAVGNEWYGLSTFRWVYDASMPVIPFIKTGITPTLQLGVLAVGGLAITERLFPKE
ncbi:MAG: hypothetical protein Q8Q18_02435 [bacterium]|nr:hypothetical protein [bacterium]